MVCRSSVHPFDRPRTIRGRDCRAQASVRLRLVARVLLRHCSCLCSQQNKPRHRTQWSRGTHVELMPSEESSFRVGDAAYRGHANWRAKQRVLLAQLQRIDGRGGSVIDIAPGNSELPGSSSDTSCSRPSRAVVLPDCSTVICEHVVHA